MNLNELERIEQIEAFLSGTQSVVFTVAEDKAARYQWLERLLVKWRYHHCSRQHRGILLRFIGHVSGYSPAQLKRLIKQHRESGHIRWTPAKSNGFERRYNDADIRLLAAMDKLHLSSSGAVIKKLCERAFQLFGDQDYVRLSRISVAHIYRLRQTASYQRRHLHHTQAQHSSVAIGERRKPFPKGQPGYIRIDTVHQGDYDKAKGVYHVNAVDEVTQFEVIVSVVGISERFLLPALEQLLEQFPFVIKSFHSDNGSEYINHQVAGLLTKLHIEFTKSRARKSNDNALAESKNAAIVRNLYGHSHIPKHWAKAMNELNQAAVYRYINFHRPCYFPVIETDAKGKQRKRYPYEAMMTPYEKLRKLDNANDFLKEGVTLESLDAFAREMTDNEAAQQLQLARQQLFAKMNEQMKKQAK